MGVNGMNGMGMGMGMNPMSAYSNANSLSNNPSSGLGNAIGSGGMTIPASPSAASIYAQHTGTHSPNMRASYQQLQQQQQQQQQQYMQQAQQHHMSQIQQPPQTPQQQMAMLGGGMGMMPNMFGGMPMNMPFAFPMGNGFPQVSAFSPRSNCMTTGVIVTMDAICNLRIVSETRI